MRRNPDPGPPPVRRRLWRRWGPWLLGVLGLVGLLAMVTLTAPRWARWLRPPAPLFGLPVSSPTPLPTPAGGRIVVKLYFEARDWAGLAIEERAVRFDPDLSRQVRAVVEELLTGPEGSLLAPFPEGTRVLEAFVSGEGEAYVDLALPATLASPPAPASPPAVPGTEPTEAVAEPEYASPPLVGSREELLAVYSIVNTVATNFPAVRRVRLLVNDRPAASLAGHVDLSHALYPDLTLLLRPPGPPAGAGLPLEDEIGGPDAGDTPEPGAPEGARTEPVAPDASAGPAPQEEPRP